MTISVTDAALDMEKRAIKRCARRNPFRSWLPWMFCGMFLTSIAGFYVFWYTDTLKNIIWSHLTLRNGTRAFDWWTRPPMKLLYKIHVFNYTNVDEFEAGRASKLRVQDLGPYIYEETLERVNVTIHDENGTLTYQEKKSYRWIGGRPDTENVTVPNVLLLFTTAKIRNIHFGLRTIASVLLSTLGEKTFIRPTVRGFIWGHDNKLFELLKPVLKLQQDISFEKFGLLAMKNVSINTDLITIHSGLQKIDNLGMVARVNGKERPRNVWDDERCDRIEGSNSNIFPPSLIEDTRRPLTVYSKELCAKLSFYFSEQVTVLGLPSLRYILKPFNYSHPENECYCPKTDDGSRVCPPAGLFNISACVFDSPLLSSFPHFYDADKSLLEQVDGLNPQREIHETYLDIHPRFATAFNGWSRFQVNLDVRKAAVVPFVGKLKDGQILPLIWIEHGLNEVPETVLDTLQKSHFITIVMETALSWSTLIGMIISLIALIFYIWKYRAGEDEKIIRKNSSGQHTLLRLP